MPAVNTQPFTQASSAAKKEYGGQCNRRDLSHQDLDLPYVETQAHLARARGVRFLKTTHRQYSESAGDFDRLCRFVIEHPADIRTQSTWCLGRLVDWKYGLYASKIAIPDFCDHNAELWFDGFGQICGFAISESGDASFTIIALKGYQFLYPEMLQWVLGNWGDRRSHPSTEISAAQSIAANTLAKARFAQTSTLHTYCFDLRSRLPELPVLAEGFRVIDMGSQPEYMAQRILRANAFEDKTYESTEVLHREMAQYEHGHNGPIYHAPTDICVMAPDGRAVAGCEALIDARNREADIERVCAHSDFRRRGLARAAIVTCMHRLRDMGMDRAYITGYSSAATSLYGSLGHVGHVESYVYEMTESVKDG
jgi:GNAT superfamily N-acetyltransferase